MFYAKNGESVNKTMIEYMGYIEASTGQPEDFTLIGSALGVSRLLLHLRERARARLGE